MKIKQVIIIIIIVVLLSIGISSYIFSRTQVLNVQEFSIVGKVGTKYGIGFNGTQILMGSITPGGKGIRHLNATNTFPFEVEVYFQIYGNISDYISIERVVQVEPGEIKNVDIFFEVPDDTKHGKYSGTLRAIYKRK